MDADQLAVERLYRTLKGEGNDRILPLVMNLADPSLGLGWSACERKNLADRGRPTLILALALIHHMVIGANVPLAEFVAWLADLGGNLIIEFVTKDDAMVQQLLGNKDDIYTDYEKGTFERALGRNYRIERRDELRSGTRTLYYAMR